MSTITAGGATSAPMIDTPKDKPASDQALNNNEPKTGETPRFSRVTPEQVKQLNDEQLERLKRFPDMSLKDLLAGHGTEFKMKGGGTFTW